MRWLRRRASAAPALPAHGSARLAADVLGGIEQRACDAIAFPREPAPSAAWSAFWREPAALGAARRLFGTPLQLQEASGAAGAVASAMGSALAGLRSSAWVAGESLAEVCGLLSLACERLIPLVVLAPLDGSGHGPYHALSDTGAWMAFAATVQEALDLVLIGHAVAEQALLPGVVAFHAGWIDPVIEPDEESLRSWLGDPREPIASPTPAQRLLFGLERRRAWAWFDPLRPVATGERFDPCEAARAQAARQLLFADPLAAATEETFARFRALSGRSPGWIRSFGLEDAERVIVAQGPAVRVAEAVVAVLRRERRERVGVVGVTWLRPFPEAALREALSGRRVAVLECLEESLAADAPLLRELRAAVPRAAGWLSAICGARGPSPQQVAAVLRVLSHPDHPERVWLERAAIPASTGFPRRDALLHAVATERPELREAPLPEADLPGLLPRPTLSVGLIGLERELPPDPVTPLLEALRDERRPFVTGALEAVAPGVIQVRALAAPEPVVDPGSRARLDWLLVAEPRAGELEGVEFLVRPGGTVVLAGAGPGEPTWPELPRSWSRALHELELRVLAVEGRLEEALALLRHELGGGGRPSGPAVTARELALERAQPAPPREPEELPRRIQRIERLRPSHDSLPRFWGEVVQPLQEGAFDAAPDPLSAAGAVPALASALEPSARASHLPVFDPQLCTGCGSCWSACPESAIGVTALGAEALLESASRRAGLRGKAADALRRAHRHLAQRLHRELSRREARALDESLLREAWDWLAERLGIGEQERSEYDRVFEATLEALRPLDPAATPLLFHQAEDEERGAGALLVLAVDPRACVGCGLCVAECPEGALRAEARDPARRTAAEQRWRAWESLPDTPGEQLTRASEIPEIGSLSALLLSRHCGQAQVGGSPGEPGSGTRLAARLVAACVEAHGQQRLSRLLRRASELRARIEERLRQRLTESFAAAEVSELEQALERVTRGSAPIEELARRLRELGAPARFDRRTAFRLARIAGELAALETALAQGADGLGMARFGVVVASEGRLADWAARYPRHPYYAPLTVAPSAAGADFARGLARGLAAAHLERVRLIARAEAELLPAAERAARLERLSALAWGDLDPEERSACPPLVLLADETALGGCGFEHLLALLREELPIKIVILDGGGLENGLETTVLALAGRHAFVLASTPAHRDHLARGLREALAWPGPAWIDLLAPSPRRHGFAPESTLERARLAVESRAHVLLRYDPAAEGAFGTRIDLAGNPALDADWGALDPGRWAAGEGRFADRLREGDEASLPLAEWLTRPAAEREARPPWIEADGRRLLLDGRLALAVARRIELWRLLREWSGLESPFVERIRQELRAVMERELAERERALRAEILGEEAELRARVESDALARLTERLTELALRGQPPSREGEAP